MEAVGLTGATGYVGGRLLPLLEAAGHRVRCLCRNPANLTSKLGSYTEVVKADLLKYDDLVSGLSGLSSVYFLVHSLGNANHFETDEEKTARNFANAARVAGVKKIIFLGGLASSETDLSPHLRSRHRVGELLLLPQSAGAWQERGKDGESRLTWLGLHLFCQVLSQFFVHSI